jgi:glutamine synthetase
MGDFLAVAKWVIRNVAHRHGMLATFTPKLEEGVAGNGLHVHLELVRGGCNVMTGSDGSLSKEALKLIGGLVHYASTLSAFGNTLASSFLRLVPKQEAPTRICWSHLNRSSLIRVPLGRNNNFDLARVVNPTEPSTHNNERGLQTVEIRSADGSALFYLLLAGLTTAAEYGLTAEGMLELAEKTRVTPDFFTDKKLMDQLEPLPTSCVACSRLLDERRDMYQDFGVFPATIIDYVVQLLAKEDDEHLNLDLSQKSTKERLISTRQVMHRDIHRH